MRAPLPFLALCCAACQSTATEDPAAVTPQRPTVSSDTSTTAVDTFELEAGAGLFDGGNASIPLTLKFGMSDSAEVFAGWSPLVHVDTAGSEETGVGDLVLGSRLRFVDETETRPSFAVQPIVKLPTADEDRNLGSGEIDFLFAGIATKSIEEWTLTGFAQLDFLGDPAGGTLFGQSIAAAASRPLPDRWGVFGELAGVFVPEADSEQVFTTIGLTYTRYRFLVFDVGVVIGWSDDAPDFGLVFGLTQNFGRVRGKSSL